MLKVLHPKRVLAALAFVLCTSSGSSADANNCQFAYSFCMPIYYACLADGGHPIDCHAMLDQCILNNGCDILP